MSARLLNELKTRLQKRHPFPLLSKMMNMELSSSSTRVLTSLASRCMQQLLNRCSHTSSLFSNLNLSASHFLDNLFGWHFCTWPFTMNCSSLSRLDEWHVRIDAFFWHFVSFSVIFCLFLIFLVEPSEKSVEIMRKFSEQYARKSGTYFCVDKGVTSVVIKVLFFFSVTQNVWTECCGLIFMGLLILFLQIWF